MEANTTYSLGVGGSFNVSPLENIKYDRPHQLHGEM